MVSSINKRVYEARSGICWLFVEIFTSYYQEDNDFQLMSVFLNHSANESVYSIKQANIISGTSENSSNLFLFGYFRLYIKYL